MPSLPSWSATTPAGRVLLAAGAALAVLSAGAVSAAVRTPPAVHRHQVTALAPPAPALDAAGCPATGGCRLRAELPAGLLAAVRRAFPAAGVQSADSTVDATTGAVYQARATLAVGTAAGLLLTAQCVPGVSTRDPESRSTSADQRSDLAGNQLALYTRIVQQVPGAPGCALRLELTAPGLATGYLAGLAALAHDPAAQVRP
ncbi:MAG TPA: hypothetical protein VMB79_17615 [Jatrophihabitans sp.]|nr:hypothetical protein [Jatrophihabitans sp.]